MDNKKLILGAKISTIVTSFLTGAVVWGSWLAGANAGLVSSFLKQKTEIIDTEASSGKVLDPHKDVNDPDYPWYFKNKHNSIAELLEDGAELCEEAEAEGAALLYNKVSTYDGENKPALPIKANSKVSFFSTGSQRLHLAGQGSHGVGDFTKANTYLKAFTDQGHQVNQTMWDRYTALHGSDITGTGNDTKNKYRRNRNSFANEYKLGDIPWSDLYEDGTEELKNSVETYGDAAIFCITRQGGEGVDMWAGDYGYKYPGQGDGVDMLKLNSNERSVLEGLTVLRRAGKIKRIIILLNTSNAVGMEFIKDKDIDVDAVVWTGGMGSHGVYAIPKLLDGTVNFSGNLPFIFYYDNYDNPATCNLTNGTDAPKRSGADGEFLDTMMQYTNMDEFTSIQKPNQYYSTYIVYKEGIYTDYRYAETRYYDVVTKRAKAGNFNYADTIAYTHGTSLSYTDFSMKIDSVTRDGVDFVTKVTVTNTGKVAGKKAVQLYTSKPYTNYEIENGIERSAVDLCGFAKTKVLQPGESEQVTINSLGRDVLASYDANNAKTYVVSPGKYYLTAANDAHDAVNNILAANGKTVADGMTSNGDASRTWSTTITKLDTDTYSRSRSTGVKISNLFDESDINKYSGRGTNHVDYTTRNDWQGTTTFYEYGKENYEKLVATEQMFKDEHVGETCDPADKIVGELPEYGRDYSENPLLDDNGNVILDHNLTLVDLFADENGDPIPTSDPKWDYLMNQMTWEEMERVCAEGQRRTAAASSIGLPYSFNYNESNGVAGKWAGATDKGCEADKPLAVAYNDPNTTGTQPILWPSNCVFTGTLNTELCEECGHIWGEEGNWAGLSGIYGPGFNFYRSAYGGRHYEYFGADPYGAGMCGAYVVKGMQAEGLFAVIKHFAFNDLESVRKSACLWVQEQAARECYLRMFEYPIVEGGALAVMGSMGRLGTAACNANKSLMTGWLKNETGLKGFATTDIAYSTTKPAAIKAGSDLFDNNTYMNVYAEYKPVEGDETNYVEFAWRLRDAAKHVAYTILHSNAINGYSKGLKFISITPPWVKVVNGVKIASISLTAISYLYLGFALVKGRKEEF